MNFKNYETIEERHIKGLSTDAVLLKHIKTGARILALPNDDDNKVFYIGFRTPPNDDTGVAHILEHSVLCGSKKYPLKDPFVELVKGSLNTFLNAMTYPDKTVYPVASRNEADFKNLMSVYLDAVFRPNIYKHEEIFRQEGWHFDIEFPADKTKAEEYETLENAAELGTADESEIERAGCSSNDPEKEGCDLNYPTFDVDLSDCSIKINGVVYNEMKGAFSSPESVLEREIMHSLYPDTPYGVESGGDPKSIPKLTHEDFLAFHSKYYHPSNSYIYLYGDMDLDERLRFLDEEYLSGYEALEVDSKILKQKPFEAMLRAEIPYPVSEEEDESEAAYLSYNIVCGDNLDPVKYYAMQMILYALVDTQGAPIRKRLLDEGIGKDILAVYECGILQPYFSIAAKGADITRADDFLRIIKEEFERAARCGINRRSLKADLNLTEFRFKEADFGGYPKGLMYGLACLDSWLYDEERPLLHVDAEGTFKELRRLLDTGYFEDLVKEFLLNNPHASLLTLKPEKGLMAKNEAETAAKLAEYKKSLSDAELKALANKAEALLEYQSEPETEENLRSIPLLSRSDIRREAEWPKNDVRIISSNKRDDNNIRNIVLDSDANDQGSKPQEIEACENGIGRKDGELSGNDACQIGSDQQKNGFLGNNKRDIPYIPAVFHGYFSGGIAYVSILFNAKNVPARLLPYLGLLKAVVSFVDTENYTYSELNDEINMNLGSLLLSCGVYESRNVPDRAAVYEDLSIRVLYENIDKAFDLAEEVLFTGKYDDTSRLKEIIDELKSKLQMGLNSAGHQAAALRASSYFSKTSLLTEIIDGIEFYKFIEGIEKNFDDVKDEVSSNIKELIGILFNPENALMSVTCDEEGWAKVSSRAEGFVRKLAEFALERVSAEGSFQADAEYHKADCNIVGNHSAETVNSSVSGQVGFESGADNNSIHGAELHGMNSSSDGPMPNDSKWFDFAAKGIVPEQKNEAFKTSGGVQYVARAGRYLIPEYKEFSSDNITEFAVPHGNAISGGDKCNENRCEILDEISCKNKNLAGFTDDEKYSGAMAVFRTIMNYEYLWQNIRVKGGAYGCMSGADPAGKCHFVTYRDPNLRKSFEVFEGIPKYLENFDADEREMTKYIIGTMSGVDAPKTPMAKGALDMGIFIRETDFRDVQRAREEIIDCKAKDIRKIAPLIKRAMAEGNICVVGSEGKIEEDKDLFKSVRNLFE